MREPQPESRSSPPLFTLESEEQFMRMIERLVNRFREMGVPVALPSAEAVEWQPSSEDEQVINEFMTMMDEEIKKYAEDLVRMEVRDKILRTGPSIIKKLKQAIKKGQKAKLKRKKGCIFVQFGEGTPDDPIDEIMIATT